MCRASYCHNSLILKFLFLDLSWLDETSYRCLASTFTCCSARLCYLVFGVLQAPFGECVMLSSIVRGLFLMLRLNLALILLTMRLILGRLQLTTYPSRWGLLTSPLLQFSFLRSQTFWFEIEFCLDCCLSTIPSACSSSKEWVALGDDRLNRPTTRSFWILWSWTLLVILILCEARIRGLWMW